MFIVGTFRAQCFLESFGEEDLHKMTLAQVSRALSISSRIGRSALAGAELPPDCSPAMSPNDEGLGGDDAADALRYLLATPLLTVVQCKLRGL